MIIPSKHSGYQAGIRLYPGGGGDGGGGGGVDPNAGEGGVAGLGTNAGGTNSAGGNGSAGFHSGPGGLFGPVNTGGLSGYVDPSGARPGGFDGGGYGSDIIPVIKPISPAPVNPAPREEFKPQTLQPIYQSQYTNYTNPAISGNVSNYGTGAQQSFQFGAPFNPYPVAPPLYQQQQYNPDSYSGNNYVDSYSGRSTGLGGRGSYQAPQQQQQYNPFSYQPQQQQQYNPFSYGGGQSYQPQQQYNPYQQSYQPQQQYNPYQQSYQQPQPQYNPYQQSYQQPQPQYSQPEIPTSSGPSQAIYGRSSAMRGTPNVMRRAEGGIAGILKK